MAIEVAGLTAKHGRRVVLDDLSLTFASPKRVGLVGVNGAGKTTLLRVLAGAHRPAKGTVQTTGFQMYRSGSHWQAASQVALMPQHLPLPPGLTAQQYVSYVTWLRGVDRTEAAERASRALNSVLLDPVANQRLGTLSGGMLRRVALAQALAAEPAVLLLDEPSTGLDPEQRRVMVDILTELKDVLLVMSSHVMEDVADVVDDVLVLDDGDIRFHGSVAALRDRAPADSRRPLEDAFLAQLRGKR